MGKRESYAPGTFSWVELATPDAAAAKTFYSSLLGWTCVDNPVGEGMTYTMCMLDDDPVAALYESSAAVQGWMSYVTVESADETAARAGELGGTVAREPFDVLDVGRMAVLQDPQGASFAIWEPRTHIGACRVNDAGCFCWNLLATPDPESAGAFYSSLLGWELEGEGPVWRIKIGENDNGTISPAPEDSPGPNWVVWFTVESLDEALASAEAGGGSVVRAPREIEIGRYAVLADPHGARFFLFEGQVDD